MKNIIVTLLLFLSLSISACLAKEQNTQVEAPSYKATTVDECIHEKECVWDAFSKQLGMQNYVEWTARGKSLTKWNGDILFTVVDGENQHHDVLRKVFPQLLEFFPFEIKPHENSNYEVIFTEDVEQAYFRVAPGLDRATSNGEAKKRWDIGKDDYEGCFSLTIENEENRSAAANLIIVDINYPHSEFCTAISVYSSLGFVGYLREQPFSFLSDKDQKNIQLTALDQFLIYLLYDENFKSGQNWYEVKKVFESIYEKKKNDFVKLNRRRE